MTKDEKDLLIEVADWLQELADDGDNAGWVLEKHEDLAIRLRKMIETHE